ncbi:OmpA family protein [Litoribacter alkaliphilus]|uniref:OmpA family protein n=1 Tax=Litoribacter ruber TaxID=702568 RepID=A0AAP2CHM1_9BACT|nr:OmpA family protein [Litoribacter alkaliphilus]MBS9524866.1 OmpA family protein [Litoribacter alkaliphilus]
MKKLLLLLVFIFSAFFVQAQDYSVIDRRAIKLHEEGEELVLKRRYDEAIQKFEASINRSSNFFESYIRWSQLLLMKGDPDQAMAVAEKGAARVKDNPKIKGDFGWLKANILMRVGKFEQAVNVFDESEPLFTDRFRTTSHYKEFVEQLNFIKKHIASPLDITKEKLPAPLNGFNLQYFPVLTADSRKILFTKRDGLSFHDNEDIFVSYYEEDGWTEPSPISTTVNTNYNEGTCTISADGNILIYTSCDAPDSFGSCDLYVTYKVNGKWQRPTNMGKNVNSRQWDSQPSLSADGSILFFSSNRRGGYGGNDIWYSVRQIDGSWGEAKNLGEGVNTPKDEVSPFIYFNNELLFFASNGHLGFGGMDIFMSRMENGVFSEPENLGYPINDHQDQLALFITAQRDFAYYTENSFKDGRLDASYLYRFPFPQEIDLGEKILVTEGRVLDSKTGKPIDARLSLVSLSNDSTIYQFRSDGESGKFMMLYPNKTFSGLYVEKKGFLPKIYNVEKDNLMDRSGMEIELTPVASGEQFLFENVFFDFDKADLRPESKSSIGRLRNFLQENPEVNILIEGHTDNVGNPGYNQQLSEKRALSVKQELISLGIAEARISTKGYGDQNPVVPNDTSSNRSKNRRIEIVVE